MRKVFRRRVSWFCACARARHGDAVWAGAPRAVERRASRAWMRPDGLADPTGIAIGWAMSPRIPSMATDSITPTPIILAPVAAPGGAAAFASAADWIVGSVAKKEVDNRRRLPRAVTPRRSVAHRQPRASD